MKKPKQPKTDEMRADYSPDFIKHGVRGKYAARFSRGTNLVPLEADVAEAFPTPEAVNGALRLLMDVAKTTKKRRLAVGKK
jgi:hypothetical protein